MIGNIYYEGRLINKPGIDRIVVKKVWLRSIDMGKLKLAMRKHNVSYDDTKAEGRCNYITDNGVEFHFLKIEDEDLGTFTFGCKIGQYGIFQFSPKEIRDGNNLVNFHVEEIHSFIEEVRKNVYDTYGLEVDFTDSVIREIEINTTFALEYLFNEYKKVIAIMTMIMPYLKNDNQNRQVDKKTETKKLSGETVHNQQVSLSVYNKSKEMELSFGTVEDIKIYDEDGVILDNELMRIECKLKTSESVSKKFHGVTRLADLNDELVLLVFKELMEYYIFNPYERWSEKNRKYLRRVIRGILSQLKDGSRWKMILLEELRNAEQNNGLPVLLDVEDLYNVLREFPDKSGHVGRRLKGFKFCENDSFLKNDRQKYTEILDNLRLAINNTNSST